VDGKLSGEIFTEDVLIVGEGAEVNAEISVGSIVIQGTVRGNIVAKRGVEIHTPGRVRGNINTPSLFVEKGVLFDGQCQMEPGGPAPEPPHRPSGKASKAGGSAPPAPPSS
jgi:cytoskeletal protein CcmA (bactofilin family)